MKIEGPLLCAKFISRPNRFITIIEVNGKKVKSHLPDPGRLKEILIPGVDLLVRPAPKSSTRKTHFSTVMAKHNGLWVSLVSALPNQFVKEALIKKEIPLFHNYKFIRPEIPVGRHRFDFLLESPQGNPFYLEVKSVTFVENGIAQFPDAVTSRGAKHATALSHISKNNTAEDAGILFVCQRPDAHEFRPMWNRDPTFSQALLDADSSGVSIWCITTHISKTHMQFYREIPLNLMP